MLLSIVVLTMVSHIEADAKSTSRSQNVVYINGSRYYVHSIEKGDTMYSLSKLYGVEEAEILASNPALGSGLRVGSNIKIPIQSEVPQEVLTERKERKTFEDHQVAAGETLYSISRRYELSVETLMNDNPELDPASLKLGQVLRIRKAEQGKTSEEETRESIEGYRRSLNSVAPAGLKYYVVESSDNFDTVAKAHEMSVEQLMRVNNMKGDAALKSGRMILVRDGASPSATAPFTEALQAQIEEKLESVAFVALPHRDTLNIALLLPLSVNGRTMQPFVEFYQGVLLGVESLRDNGRNVVLNLYNTERNATRVNNIISQPSYKKCQLVIGPVYENLLDIVVRDAELRSVPVVSPLATITKSDSPVLFQMAPDPKHRYDKMDDLLGEDRRVTLIEGESNDQSFKREVMRILASRDIGYYIHEYEYEHPSLIQEREREAEKRIKAAREEAEERGEELEEAVIDSLSAKVSKSDLTPLLMGEDVEAQLLTHDGVISMFDDDTDILQSDEELDDEEMIAPQSEPQNVEPQSDDENDMESDDENNMESDDDETENKRVDEPIHHTLFVLSNDEIEVDRILSALSSAYAAQLAINRGSGRNIREMIKYDVVANPEWRRYKNIDRAIYFRNKVVVFSSYLASRDAENIRHFDSRYASAFGEFPSLYSYRGYDAIMIFGEGLYSDIQYDMEGRTYQPLQSKYRFERDEDRTAIVNINWMREGYNTNFTKTIE